MPRYSPRDHVFNTLSLRSPFNEQTMFPVIHNVISENAFVSLMIFTRNLMQSHFWIILKTINTIKQRTVWSETEFQDRWRIPIYKHSCCFLNDYFSGFKTVVYWYFFSLTLRLRLWPASSEDLAPRLLLGVYWTFSVFIIVHSWCDVITCVVVASWFVVVRAMTCGWSAAKWLNQKNWRKNSII